VVPGGASWRTSSLRTSAGSKPAIFTQRADSCGVSRIFLAPRNTSFTAVVTADAESAAMPRTQSGPASSPTVIASSTEKARDVALALIPEAIASSIIAGVDPKVGLYASFSIAVIIIDFTGGRSGMISAATGDGAGDGVFAAALVAPWLFLVIAPISVLYIPAARDDDQAREQVAATLDSQCRRRWETDMCSAGSAARMACTHRKGREPSCPCGTVGAGDLSDAGAKPGVAYGGVAVQKYPSGRSRPT
jgi:hypothetical protein